MRLRMTNHMPTIELNGHAYAVDEAGFLEDPTIWSDRVALDLAATEGLTGLTDEHWRVIRYVREYYLSHNIAPMVRRLCKETETKLTRIFELFPSGPAQGACKVAGLPKPTGCV
jgi:dissimilatory sulfite reductase related protein